MPAKKKKRGTKKPGRKGQSRRAMALKAGEKARILVVAVGERGILTDVYSSPPTPTLRQAIIPALGRALEDPPYSHPRTTFQIDYVDGMPGQDLYAATNTYVDRYHGPHLVLTIASSATKAAREVFGTQPTDTPVVFVVISNPIYEGIVYSHSEPGGNTTGVSTLLSQTAAKAIRIFMDKVTSLSKVLWMHRDMFPPAHLAFDSLCDAATAMGKTPDRQLVKDLKGINSVIDSNKLPKRDPTKAPETGLFVAPDDLVVSYGAKVISRTQGKKSLPTFFQVLEFVKDSPNVEESALGAYGIPGDTIGTQAAEFVDKIVWGKQKPGTLRVKELKDDSYFQFWWNNEVARKLRCPTLTQGPGGADKVFQP